MIAYAGVTNTRRNLAALRDAGWRLIVSPLGGLNIHNFRYALDNGAWGAFKKGIPFDEDAFRDALDKLALNADWIVVPDIVEGGKHSLSFSLSWLPKLHRYRKLLLAVQDGISPEDLMPLVSKRVGIFIGGSTEWKVRTMALWGALAKKKRCYLHVGRVNSVYRIQKCIEIGANSFDGTSASRFAKSLPRLNAAVRTQGLFDAL